MPRSRRPHIPDFGRFRRQFAALANAVLERETEAFAIAERDRFKADLERQVFPAFRRYPLTERYLRRKQLARADARVMLATHWYKNHIRVWRWRPPVNRARTRGWRVGFHPTVLARDLQGRRTDLPLHRLARVHEHGSLDQRVPPRPHWRPHLLAMARRARAVRRRIRAAIMDAARRRFRRFA